MKRQYRFRYAGTWTRWFDAETDDVAVLKGVEIEAVEISEEMSREEFLRQFPVQAFI